jgi:RNA methyltransferase, TrmH family
VPRRLQISSSANPRLKALRKRARTQVLAEGARALRAALASGVDVREVYAAPELYLGRADAALVAAAERAGARVHEVGAVAFRTVTGRARPDGILAVVERPETLLGRLRLPAEPLLVIAVGIERPGNLGALARTACAVGADALLVADAGCDVYHRDVVRSSVGTIFHLPVATSATSPILEWLSARRIRVLAATPAGRVGYRTALYSGGTAVAFGSERHGLPDAWLDAADETVSIAMPGPADSLNVGVAAGVVLFQALAERERVRLHAGREAQLEQRVDGRPLAHRVEPVAVDVDRRHVLAVDECADGPVAAQDDVDVAGLEVEAQPRVRARSDLLRADLPVAGVRERVRRK